MFSRMLPPSPTLWRQARSELPTEVKTTCVAEALAKAGVPVLKTKTDKRKTFRQKIFWPLDPAGLMGVRGNQQHGAKREYRVRPTTAISITPTITQSHR
jgi:hypothetical protein